MAKTRSITRRERDATSWYGLPTELRLMIMDFVLAPSDISPGPNVAARSDISHLPSVCKDWQEFFEPHTFRQLVVRNSGLSTFRDAIEHNPVRLSYIENILLIIKLEESRCESCHKVEGEATINQNDRIFSSCIRELLKPLSRWRPGRHHQPTGASASGITLEVSAVASSDSRHYHSSCALDDDYPVRFESDLRRITKDGLAQHHRLKALQYHGSHHEPNGHPHGNGLARRPFFHSFHKRRVIGTPLRLRPTVPSLPRVTIVKTLVVRQQSYRNINIRSLAQILRQSLVALECFRFERRRPIMPSHRHFFNEGSADLIQYLIPAMPSTLRRLYLSVWLHYPYERSLNTLRSIAVANALASSRVCRKLTEFSVDSQACSNIFLASLGHERPPHTPKVPLPCWRNIEFLCVSPDCFRSLRPPLLHNIRLTIRMAAEAIRLTPTLRVLELWGSSPYGSAYIFRYKAGQGQNRPDVTWMSSVYLSVNFDWTFWAETFPRHVVPQGFNLSVTPFPESTQQIQMSQGRCILKHLELKRLAVDPLTLAQFEAETRQN